MADEKYLEANNRLIATRRNTLRLGAGALIGSALGTTSVAAQETNKREFLGEPEVEICSIAFSNDGELVAVGTGESFELPKVHIYSVGDWTHVTELSEIPSNNIIDSISFNEDDSRIAYTGAYDVSKVYVHNTSNWELEKTISGNQSLYAVDYVSGSGQLAYGGTNEVLRIVNSDDSESEIPLDGRIRSIDSTESGYVSVATNVGSIHIFEVEDQEWNRITTLNESEGEARSVSFSPKENYIAYDDLENEVVNIHTIGGDWEQERSLSLVNDSSSGNGNIPTGGTRPGSVSFSPDEDLFAYPGGSTVLVHQTTDEWSVRLEKPHEEAATSEVQFSPDSKWLLYSVDTDLHIIDEHNDEEPDINTTFILENVGNSAWEVAEINGGDVTAPVGEENPTVNLEEGLRYRIENEGWSSHPLAFESADGTVLLNQDGDGTFENDESVEWFDEDDAVEFTLTESLASELSTYVCTVHESMEGSIGSRLDEPEDELPEEHESGVDQELFDAVDQSGDGEVNLGELRDAVEQWGGTGQVNGVDASLSDLRALVDWSL